MANTFKTLTPNDKAVIRNMLHESIPITGSIINTSSYSNNNIKNFSHGLFQQVYDYPYLSSSANHILDITTGYSNRSALSSSTNYLNKQKINMYNQMAKVLVGVDPTGSVMEFDEDGDMTAGTKIREAVFINFARLLTKDGIKKGSFTLEIGVGTNYHIPHSSRLYVKDLDGATSWKTNSPAGEYGILIASNSVGVSSVTNEQCGLLYYQAGIAVLTASLFMGTGSGGIIPDSVDFTSGSITPYAINMNSTLTGSTLSGTADGFRQRWYNCSFNNTIELNSLVHFVRIGHNEFNYSANPTYLTGSKIRVKNNAQDDPVSYITTVGLYSDDNELLAVGKLSEPLKKKPGEEILIRTRLDT